ncbi:hypothetical protein FRC09_008342 [Ceratobasidium sp. 395]|nr:hypothetical protein FRC09_008342 [Ceratobasidium sp. 395]
MDSSNSQNNAPKTNPGKKAKLTTPQLTLHEISCRLHTKLNKTLKKPEEEDSTKHLWSIAHMLSKHLGSENDELWKAAWGFYLTLTTYISRDNEASHDVFLSATQDLHNKLELNKDSVDSFAQLLKTFPDDLKEAVKKDKRLRKNISRNSERAERRDAAKQSGLVAVGNANLPLTEIFFIDIDTRYELEDAALIAPLPDFEGDPNSSIPPGAVTEAYTGAVTPEMMHSEDYKVYHSGTYFFFRKAPNGQYQFVLGGMWRDLEELPTIGQEHLHAITKWADKAVKDGGAYKDDKNKAHEALEDKQGEIYMVGWHPSMVRKQGAILYAPPQNISRHGSVIVAWLGMNYKSVDMAEALMWFQRNQFAPAVAKRTSKNLQRLGLPSFGEVTVDFSKHEPALGSNLSLSRHDKRGCNFGNAMHTDKDIDSLKEIPGVVHTTGQWWFGNREGKAEGDMNKIKDAFSPAYFIFPGYKIAFNLNSHSYLMAIWQGGLDEHGTTTSTVDLKSGLTRWGCSCQANRNLPTRVKNQGVEKDPSPAVVFSTTHERRRESASRQLAFDDAFPNHAWSFSLASSNLLATPRKLAISGSLATSSNGVPTSQMHPPLPPRPGHSPLVLQSALISNVGHSPLPAFSPPPIHFPPPPLQSTATAELNGHLGALAPSPGGVGCRKKKKRGGSASGSEFDAESEYESASWQIWSRDDPEIRVFIFIRFYACLWEGGVD